ncbi:hypothetical protein [Pseudomonas sp. AE27]|uniref:hypothetical protein n=1 Tax=Pseudomonas sp. AE27 TaxID=3127460 RepID=UPI0030CC98B9
MDTNKMREQFESFAREVMGWEDGDFRLGSDEKSYYWGTTGDAWVFWQASREAVVVDLGAPSHWVADYAACGGGMTVFDAEKAAKVTDPMCSKTPSYTIHALEKAGLKVAP